MGSTSHNAQMRNVRQVAKEDEEAEVAGQGQCLCQSVKHLPYKCKDLSSVLRTCVGKKACMYKPQSWETWRQEDRGIPGADCHCQLMSSKSVRDPD